jgi:hypothetical protein
MAPAAISAAELLDLTGLAGPAVLAAGLRAIPEGTVVPPLRPWLALPFDADSEAALVARLARFGVIGPAGRVDSAAAGRLADQLAFAAELAVELERRRPAGAARLVMTTANLDTVRDLRRRLAIPVLFQHVEDVVRDTVDDLVLAAPYWNLAGLERLRPAIVGALSRRHGRLTLLAQGGGNEPTVTLPGLRRFVTGLTADGLAARLLVFAATTDADTNVFFHAKFALSDNRAGYLGSANMTNQGMVTNLELGVRLDPADVAVLRDVLATFEAAGILRPCPEPPLIHRAGRPGA